MRSGRSAMLAIQRRGYKQITSQELMSVGCPSAQLANELVGIDYKELSQLADRQKNMFTLERPFYTSPTVHTADLELMFGKSWLFACHSCEVRKPGEYVTYDVGQQSVIIARGKDMKIRAFYNTCRHRGFRLCNQTSGRRHKFVCPYHRWQYDFEGNLVNTPNHTNSDIDHSQFGLLQVPCREFGGLVFINLDPNAADTFDEFEEYAGKHLAVQGVENAKAIVVEDFVVDCNWKLLVENNRDCDHCVAGHPEYNKVSYDVDYIYSESPDGTFSRKHRSRASSSELQQQQLSEVQAREKEQHDTWNRLGLPRIESVNVSFPGAGWYRVSRVFLRPERGYHSLTGKPGSSIPLLTPPNPPSEPFHKNCHVWDAGVLRINTFPNFFCYILPDHVASVRLTPIDAQRTAVRHWWLVHRDAIEGVHYQLDTNNWRNDFRHVWQATMEQDIQLCEGNQLGVKNKAYKPGPYSKHTELGVNYFVHGWYMRYLRERLAERTASA